MVQIAPTWRVGCVMVIEGVQVVTVVDGSIDPTTMTLAAIHAELALLMHKCATVASFGGSMARQYAWKPRIAVLQAELERR